MDTDESDLFVHLDDL